MSCKILFLGLMLLSFGKLSTFSTQGCGEIVLVNCKILSIFTLPHALLDAFWAYVCPCYTGRRDAILLKLT